MSPELRTALRRLEDAIALPEKALMRQFRINAALYAAADAYNSARDKGSTSEVSAAVTDIARMRRLPRHPARE
jgi:hypothetical protein